MENLLETLRDHVELPSGTRAAAWLLGEGCCHAITSLVGIFLGSGSTLRQL